jgi:hypothetical protein
MIDHSVLCSSQGHLRTQTCDLDHPILNGAKTPTRVETEEEDGSRVRQDGRQHGERGHK